MHHNRPEDVIKHDLLDIKMEWPFSCYGLNVSWESGDNILHGDFSPEELRCEAYAQSRGAGNIEKYQQTVRHFLQQRQGAITEVLNDLSRAVALGRTPRAVRLQHLASTTTPVSQLPSKHETGSSAIPQLPSRGPSTDADFDSYTFGGIPELPPT